ncbi:TolC family protein [Vulgatibacter incomptus]|uniref:Heavy metal RND efflux outer membrane protein, CzcC family n=1 Tax=Vulgatibacter incomptus TaxID=1391653 RepID=A0A0K1PIA0_9BACT|nr:TolC family protein [Vulgatibacter incomptus]AKU93141.1 Heavy metal RND efflux outer membrane protein, CzcC family [Vulgatibacter incomptus]
MFLRSRRPGALASFLLLTAGRPAFAEVEAEASPASVAARIASCLEADPRLLAGKEEIHQAEAEEVTASLVPNPELQVASGLVPFPWSPFDDADHPGGPPQLEAIVSMPLDWLVFGKRAAARESAGIGVDVAKAGFDDLRRQRLLAALEAHYDLAEAAGVRELADEAHREAERLYSITAARVGAGGAEAVELDRVRVSIAERRRELALARAAETGARARYEAIVGRGCEEPGSLEGPAPEPVSEHAALELAEKSRPDLVGLRLHVDQSGAELRKERADAFPELSVEAGYTRQFQRKAMGAPDAHSWGVGLTVGLPIFDRNQGGLAKARSVRRQAEHELEASRREARAEVTEAVRNYEASFEIATTHDEEALRAATRAKERIEEAYALGGRSLLEVLDAQESWREARRNHLSSRAELWRSLSRLQAAVGVQVLP